MPVTGHFSIPISNLSIFFLFILIFTASAADIVTVGSFAGERSNRLTAFLVAPAISSGPYAPVLLMLFMSDLLLRFASCCYPAATLN